MLNFNSRTAFVRNLTVASLNGALTLIILLIAPLGLAAVLFNTILVTLASFATAAATDRVITFLQRDPTQQAELLPRTGSSSLQKRDPQNRP